MLADLRWARAEAIKRNKKVRVTFTPGGSWSYTIDTVPALAVSDGILPKTVNGIDFPSTTLTTASFTGGVAYTTFDPTRGTNPNNGTITITSSNFSADVIVSTLGRARICGSMGGYETC
ncbi:GspH/FimT family protein [Methylobacter sp. YRD-M1]|nr:GspH/FimT family protein [Methylobacter sp. YRD-M1]